MTSTHVGDKPADTTGENTADTTGDAVRRGYIAGLRALADLLEQRPDLPTPTTGRVGAIETIDMFTAEAAAVETVAELLGRPAAVRFSEAGDRMAVWLTWHLHGLALLLAPFADEVCERRVTGRYRAGDQTHEVTEWVLPDHLQPADDAAGQADRP